MFKHFYCTNIVIDSVKDFSIDRLRIFYKLLYEYKMENDFRPDLIDEYETEIIIHKSIMQEVLKKSKMNFSEGMELICDMPNKLIVINGDGNKIKAVSIFDSIEYDFYTEEYIINFNEDSLKLLDTRTNDFSVFYIDQFLNNSSKYSTRMFELCCRFRILGKCNMTIDQFKKYFKVPSTYKMCNIDQKILKKSIDEVNKNTNFNIQYKKIKKRNIVTNILFDIKEKNKTNKMGKVIAN